MDERRFDDLAKTLASRLTRRRLIEGIAALSASTAIGKLRPSDVEAARRGSTPTPVPATCSDGMTACDGGCCDGDCTSTGACCPAGRSVCGPTCCASPAACCDNACCPDGTVCIGEELCCPAEAMCGDVCCLEGVCLDGTCCDAASVCGDSCCAAEEYQCCEGACLQCCTDDDCDADSVCNASGACVPGCNGDGDCDGGTCLGGVCCAGCAIEGTCVATEDVNPLNLCEYCDPAVSATSWGVTTCGLDGLTQCAGPQCNPSSGLCETLPWNEGGACSAIGLDPNHQCRQGACRSGECVPAPAPDGTVCTTEQSPNFCAAGGEGTCQAGQCIAGAANEGVSCGIDNDSFPACGSLVCRSGLCTREAINDGLECSASATSQLPCREDDGICTDGICQRPQLPENSVCGEVRFAQGPYCVSEICNASGQCRNRYQASCSVSSGSKCAGMEAIGCAEDGSCLFTHGARSFGLIACGGLAEEPDDSKCCPGQVCIPPPINGGGVQFGYGCWYPEDIPA